MKKMTKLICSVMGAGLLLTGCATVGNISNTESEILYNGNAGVVVGEHLYFGNAFEDATFSTDSDYKNSTAKSYLARLNGQADLLAKDVDYSPKVVEKVASEVVGHENSFVFVLGNYIYYATPNRTEFEENGKPVKKYDYTTFYRSSLDGNKRKAIYTTKGAVSQIEVLKSKTDGKYYIVALAGSDLLKICIGKGTKAQSDVTILAEDVVSVAIPKTYEKDNLSSSLDWNENIYYTTTPESGSGTKVCVVKITEKEGDELDGLEDDFKFVGRDRDVVFFTITKNSVTTSYVKDLTGLSDEGNQYAITRNNDERNDLGKSAISDVSLLTTKISSGRIVDGFVFLKGGSLYKGQKNGDVYDYTELVLQNEGSALSSYQVLNVTGQVAYIFAENTIYRADLTSQTTIECRVVTKMTEMKSDITAFDSNYVYFYAKLEEVELAEGEVAEEDTNYYLYRANLNKQYDEEDKNYQLLSKTVIASRQSK